MIISFVFTLMNLYPLSVASDVLMARWCCDILLSILQAGNCVFAWIVYEKQFLDSMEERAKVYSHFACL